MARNRPLLSGYLMIRVGALDRRHVNIKLDERQGERRRQSERRDQERRRGERRLRTSLDNDFHSRGYAIVVMPEAKPSQHLGPHRVESTTSWRPRSSRWKRGVKGARRHGRVVFDLGVAMAIATGAGILWFLREPNSRPGAVLRSIISGTLALSLWGLARAWCRREARRRERRRRS